MILNNNFVLLILNFYKYLLCHLDMFLRLYQYNFYILQIIYNIHLYMQLRIIQNMNQSLQGMLYITQLLLYIYYHKCWQMLKFHHMLKLLNLQ